MPLSIPQAAEARSVDAIPDGEVWQYEPKWDGFRCLLARDGEHVTMHSKAGEDLARYFPEIVGAALTLRARSFILDGEIVIPQGRSLSFDDLLQRIHPAASRIRKLAAETPAILIAFDLLADPKDADLAQRPLDQRRLRLEQFAGKHFSGTLFRLSRCARDIAQARRWLAAAGGGCDGIVAKRLDLPYRGGTREGMQKIKRYRSADCVIGGFRYNEKTVKGSKVVGSLLLGLYDDGGLLHHVGFSSGLKAAEKAALTEKLSALKTATSFTGQAPGGPSRWSTKRSSEWQPVEPKLVVEVSYDHFSGGRFRHGTSILRWRPDKRAEQCTMDQLTQKLLDIGKLLQQGAAKNSR
jgi:ATP-dependent DNA ligase